MGLNSSKYQKAVIMKFFKKNRFSIIGIAVLFIGLSAAVIFGSIFSPVLRNIKGTFLAPSATAIVTSQRLTVGEAVIGLKPLMASGGTQPYVYSVSSGKLPVGLALDPKSGIVTGIPRAVYSKADVIFSVKDANNAVAETRSRVSFIVHPAPTATAFNSAQHLVLGVPLKSFRPLVASGGTGIYIYSVSSGKLPEGLTLDSKTGLVDGTPTSALPATDVTFIVKDENNVVASTISRISFSVNSGISAKAFSRTQSLTLDKTMKSFRPLIAIGGQSPYTYCVSAGKLPLGLNLNSKTGVVTGIPKEVYSKAKVGFSVKDGNNSFAAITSKVDFIVNSAVTVKANSSVQNLTVGSPIHNFMPLVASGGSGRYIYKVITGELPAGLKLDAKSGKVFGTPSTVHVAPSEVVFSVKDINDSVASTKSTVLFIVNEPETNVSDSAGSSNGITKDVVSTASSDSGVRTIATPQKAPALNSSNSISTVKSDNNFDPQWLAEGSGSVIASRTTIISSSDIVANETIAGATDIPVVVYSTK